MTDEEIKKLYFARSEEAISATEREYGRYCRYIAYKILNSNEDTEECVNDALLTLWNKIPPEDPVSLRSYLGAVTRNIALDKLDGITADKRNRDLEVSFDEFAECLPDTKPDFSDSFTLKEAFNGFLSGLKKEQRIVFMQRYWYHCSVAEIASKNGLSEPNVKVILHRTRASLKKYLIKELGYNE